MYYTTPVLQSTDITKQNEVGDTNGCMRHNINIYWFLVGKPEGKRLLTRFGSRRKTIQN
jgi:hypothetical protein